MGLTPEQVEERARAAAHRVFGHLEGERLIPRFVDSYIMGFDRRHLKNPPDQFLARSNQLGRLALVLLGRLVVEKCCGQLYRFRLGPLRLADPSAQRRFREKFWESLAAELKLGPEVGMSLAHEAEEFRDPAERSALFRERVAPLLDPAPQMKDKAEHAGQKFYEALDTVAEQVARRVFGRD
ncbi:MAG: hypothetical protein HY656_07010 [Acidobacteria bacterium]|nr:hypothetical protein [Acidobacteriota bacterium]